MRTNPVSANSGKAGVDRSSAIRKAYRETQRGASIEELHLAGGTCARGGNGDVEGKNCYCWMLASRWLRISVV